jgi:hypothetical protein
LKQPVFIGIKVFCFYEHEMRGAITAVYGMWQSVKRIESPFGMDRSDIVRQPASRKRAEASGA